MIVLLVATILITVQIVLKKVYGYEGIVSFLGSIIRKKLSGKIQRLIVNKKEEKILEEIYTPLHYEKMSSAYKDIKLGALGIILVFGLILSVVLGSRYTSDKKIGNEIIRPSLGEGEKVEKLKYVIEEGNDDFYGSIKLELDEVMTDEQKIEMLEDRYHDFVKIILGENTSMNYVSKDLIFNKEPFDDEVFASYTSSNENLLSNNGILRKDNMNIGDSYEVSVLVTLEYENVSLPITLNFVLTREAISIKEDMDIIGERIKKGESSYILPSKLTENKNEIIWYRASSGVKWYKILASFFIIFAASYYFFQQSLEEKKEERKRKILVDFPDFIGKIILLLKVGFTIKKSLVVICDQYEKNKTHTKPLYEELSIMLKSLENGVSFEAALLSFSKRCENKEINAMTGILMHSSKLGSSMLVVTLQQLGKEAWDLRVNNAKMIGEKASTRLLLPLGISFLAVILIIMSPVMMSMNF